MSMDAMLLLAFGGLDWSFPWWLWCLAILDAACGVFNALMHDD